MTNHCPNCTRRALATPGAPAPAARQCQSARFDIEAWMLESGLRATGYVRKDEGNRRLAAFSGRFIDAVDALRERIRERILPRWKGGPTPV